MYIYAPCVRVYLHVPCVRVYLQVPCVRVYLHVTCVRVYLHVPCVRVYLHVPCIQVYLHVPCIQVYLHVPCTVIYINPMNRDIQLITHHVHVYKYIIFIQTNNKRLSTSLGPQTIKFIFQPTPQTPVHTPNAESLAQGGSSKG